MTSMLKWTHGSRVVFSQFNSYFHHRYYNSLEHMHIKVNWNTLTYNPPKLAVWRHKIPFLAPKENAAIFLKTYPQRNPLVKLSYPPRMESAFWYHVQRRQVLPCVYCNRKLHPNPKNQRKNFCSKTTGLDLYQSGPPHDTELNTSPYMVAVLVEYQTLQCSALQTELISVIMYGFCHTALINLLK